MKRQYYISSGKLNAMYTLRYIVSHEGYCADSYVCNLSTDADKAEEKALTYFNAISDRGTGTGLVLLGGADFELFERRSVLSVRDTFQISIIEQGIFPFGKHEGELIADAPASYLLYFADMVEDESSKPVILALSAVCRGIALDKGYIAIRDKQNAERDAKKKASQHIGVIGEKLTTVALIEWNIEKMGDFGLYRVICLNMDGNLLHYMGSKNLGDKGDTISLSFKVKSHDVYEGSKTTKISYPKVV